jgi:hypothetical protein
MQFGHGFVSMNRLLVAGLLTLVTAALIAG